MNTNLRYLFLIGIFIAACKKDDNSFRTMDTEEFSENGDYFAFKINEKRCYEGEKEFCLVFTDNEKEKNGINYAVIKRQGSKEDQLYYRYEDGNYYYYQTLGDLGSETIFLKENSSYGAQWSDTLKSGDTELINTYVSLGYTEKMNVNGTAYTDIIGTQHQIITRIHGKELTLTWFYFYAKNVGLIKASGHEAFHISN